MKVFIKLFTRVVIAAFLFTVISSCAKEYDMSESNIDKTIALGGDSLIFPLGNTKPIYLTKLMNIETVSFLKKDENGNYSIVFTDSLKKSIDFSDYKNSMKIDEVSSTVNFEKKLPDLPYNPLITLPDVETSFNIDTKIKVPFSFDDIKELKRLDSLLFSEGGFFFDFMYSKDIDFAKEPDFSLKITFEDKFLFYDEDLRVDNNVFTLNGKFDSNKKYTLNPDLKFRGMKFDWDKIAKTHRDTLDISLEATVNVTIAYSDFEALSGKVVTFSIKAGSSALYPANFYGTIDYKLDPISQSVVIEGIPDFMKSDDVSLDFYNPHIDIQLKSNAGLSMTCDVEALPFSGKEPSLDNKLEFSLWMDKSPLPDHFVTTSFWISELQEGIKEGYNFIQSPVGNIIKKIPDSIQMNVEASTKTNEQHILDFNAQYGIDMKYELNVPFSFGESLAIQFKDTVANIPSALSGLIKKGSIGLVGEVESLVPVTLELSVSAMDANNQIINAVTSTVQKISPCTSNTKPEITPLKLTISSSSKDIPDISSLILVFRITSGTVPGLQINDNSYVSAVLKAHVPGGIVINLDENKN
jgi:hypothetical protein